MDDPGSVKDTTKLLWDYYFKVRIPYLQSRSIDHVKLLGVNLSGNRHVDNDIQNQLITTYMTISDMVDKYKEGIPVRVVNVADTKKIYEYITFHLEAWKDRLFRGINIGNAPVDDLIAMDYFANTVYQYAKYTIIENLPDSITTRYMASLQSLNPNNFFVKKIINEDEEKLPERNSFSSFFQEKSIVNRRY